MTLYPSCHILCVIVLFSPFPLCLHFTPSYLLFTVVFRAHYDIIPIISYFTCHSIIFPIPSPFTFCTFPPQFFTFFSHFFQCLRFTPSRLFFTVVFRAVGVLSLGCSLRLTTLHSHKLISHHRFSVCCKGLACISASSCWVYF